MGNSKPIYERLRITARVDENDEYETSSRKSWRICQCWVWGEDREMGDNSRNLEIIISLVEFSRISCLFAMPCLRRDCDITTKNNSVQDCKDKADFLANQATHSSVETLR